MRSIDDQDVIQAFFSDTANPPFSDSVCIWCLKRGVDDVDAFRLKDGIEGLAEFGVIVMDKESQN